jgi:hypothetical protein
MGEARKEVLSLGFDGSIRLEFRGATIFSDTGLFLPRDVDDAFALTATAGAALKDCRTGTNIRHSLTALLRQSVYSRLAGYDVVNEADQLAVDPVMRQLGRRLVLPVSVKHWTLTTLRNKLIKIGCKVVHHARRVVFQLAEMAVSGSLFALILRRIERLRLRLLTPVPP